MPLNKASLSIVQKEVLEQIDNEWDDYIAPAICGTRFAGITIDVLFPNGLEHASILEKSRTGQYLRMTVKSLYEHKIEHGFATHLDSELRTTVRSRVEHGDRIIRSYINEVHSHKVMSEYWKKVPQKTKGAIQRAHKPFVQPSFSAAFVDSMLVDTLKRSHNSWASKFMATCSELDLVTTQALIHPPLMQERMYRAKLVQALSKRTVDPVVFKLMTKYSHLSAMSCGRQLNDHAVLTTSHRAFHNGYRCYWTTTICGLASLAVGTNGQNKDIYAAQILKYVTSEFSELIQINYDAPRLLEHLGNLKNIQLNREVPNRLKLVIRAAVTAVEWSRLHDLSEAMRIGLAKKFDEWLLNQATIAQQSASERVKLAEMTQEVLTKDAWVGTGDGSQSNEAPTWDGWDELLSHDDGAGTSQASVSAPDFVVETTLAHDLPDLGPDLGLLSETDDDLSPASPKRCRVDDVVEVEEDLSFLDDFIDRSPNWRFEDFEEFR